MANAKARNIKRSEVIIPILAAFLCFLMLPPCAPASEIGLDIRQFTSGRIVDIIHPYYVDLYERMSITVIFRNTGSVDINERIYFEIINWTSDLLANLSDISYTLKPGEERAFITSYIPMASGYQWIHAKVPYDGGKEEEGWSSFYVWPVTEPTDEPGPPDGDGEFVPPIIEVGIPKMRLNYSDYVVVSKGQSYLIYLMVENLGARYGNVSLDNIIFFAKSIGIPFTVVPEKIQTLKTRESGFFLITLNVPKNIDAGGYVLDFTVMSDETQQSGKIYITVEELPTREEVWSIIQNYLFIIERLKREIREAMLDGANTTLAEQHLNSSIVAVSEAIDYFNKEDYEAAKRSLAITRIDLETTVLELALARSELLRIVLPAFVTLLLLILIIIAVAATLFFVYARRKKRKRERVLKTRA